MCRVLNCIFEHHAALFSSVKLTRYIPPISGPLDLSKLPDTPAAIELEMKKQESLLSELHAEVNKTHNICMYVVVRCNRYLFRCLVE